MNFFKDIFFVKFSQHHDGFQDKKLLNFLNFLIILLPFALISGSFLSDLTISLASLILLFLTIKNKKKEYIIGALSILFFCFYLYLLIRSLFSDNIYLSLESSFFFFRFILFFMVIRYIIIINLNFISAFSKVLIFCFMLILIFVILQFFFSYSPFNQDYIGERASGLFGQELILGSYISRILPILIATIAFSFNNNLKNQFMIIVILVISFFLVIISGERTALYNIVLYFSFASVLSVKIKKIFLFSIISSLFLSILIISFNENIKYRLIDKTLIDTNLINFDAKKLFDNKIYNLYIFAPTHMIYFESSLKMFNSNKLFGIGPKMYREACSYDRYTDPESSAVLKVENSCATHPHNMYVQLLAETGYFGFFPIFMFFLFISYVFLKQFYFNLISKKYLSDYKLHLYLAAFISLWPLIPSGNIFHNWTSIIYFLPVGFLISKPKKND